MKKVDRVKDLPKWFDLSNYKRASEFTAAQWYEQLERRSQFFPGSNEPPHDEVSWAVFFGSLESIRAEPLAFRRGRQGFVPASPVRSLSLIDLMMQSFRDEIALNEGKCTSASVERWRALGDPHIGLVDGVRLSRTPLEVNFYKPTSLPIPMIQVDLAATDAALKKAFDIWLKQARNAGPKTDKKPIKPLYNRWSKYGLLPYLDLLIWSMETGISIPDRIYSAATAANDYDMGESSFRKTVVPLAAALMQDLTELQALAAVEESSREELAPETF